MFRLVHTSSSRRSSAFVAGHRPHGSAFNASIPRATLLSGMPLFRAGTAALQVRPIHQRTTLSSEGKGPASWMFLSSTSRSSPLWSPAKRAHGSTTTTVKRDLWWKEKLANKKDTSSTSTDNTAPIHTPDATITSATTNASSTKRGSIRHSNGQSTYSNKNGATIGSGTRLERSDSNSSGGKSMNSSTSIGDGGSKGGKERGSDDGGRKGGRRDAWREAGEEGGGRGRDRGPRIASRNAMFARQVAIASSVVAAVCAYSLYAELRRKGGDGDTLSTQKKNHLPAYASMLWDWSDVFQHTDESSFKQQLAFCDELSGRDKDVNTMSSMFSADPHRPVVLSGPEGVGKSVLVRKSLSASRSPHVVVSCESNGGMSGMSDFVSALESTFPAHTSGPDVHPPATSLPVHQRMKNVLERVSKNLEHYHEEGGSGRVPVIVIDDMSGVVDGVLDHSLDGMEQLRRRMMMLTRENVDADASSIADEQAAFVSFFAWMRHVCNQEKLAHVVLVSSDAFLHSKLEHLYVTPSSLFKSIDVDDIDDSHAVDLVKSILKSSPSSSTATPLPSPPSTTQASAQPSAASTTSSSSSSLSSSSSPPLSPAPSHQDLVSERLVDVLGGRCVHLIEAAREVERTGSVQGSLKAITYQPSRKTIAAIRDAPFGIELWEAMNILASSPSGYVSRTQLEETVVRACGGVKYAAQTRKNIDLLFSSGFLYARDVEHNDAPEHTGIRFGASASSLSSGKPATSSSARVDDLSLFAFDPSLTSEDRVYVEAASPLLQFVFVNVCATEEAKRMMWQRKKNKR